MIFLLIEMYLYKENIMMYIAEIRLDLTNSLLLKIKLTKNNFEAVQQTSKLPQFNIASKIILIQKFLRWII